MGTTKMPLASIDELNNPQQRLVGETYYVAQECNYDDTEHSFKWKDMPSEEVKLHIYLAGPKYMDDKMKADFGKLGDTFVSDIKTYVSMFNMQTLQKLVEKDKGCLRLTVNGQKIELVRGVHFYLSMRDKQA